MIHSQKILILNHLKQGRTLSQAEAINLYMCYRLSAIIKCLRNAGYDIETHKVKNRSNHASHARYELKEVQS